MAAMERAPIQVPLHIKKAIQDLKEREGFKSEWQVIEFLLEVEKEFDSREINAFLNLRKAMFQSFQENRNMTIEGFRQENADLQR